MRFDLYDMTTEEMQEFAVSLGEKQYRGRQLFRWIYKPGERSVPRKHENSLEDLLGRTTDLPGAFREAVRNNSMLGDARVEDVKRDPQDGTMKFLIAFGREGGQNAVESVFMKYRYGNTLCVSSQIGCRMGCTFCASAIGGLVRDLSAGEMVAQVMLAEEAAGERIDHIVVMGMGEPFDNYDNVSRFLRIMHEPEGRMMSWRNMTVSTSGIIPMIERFGDDFPQVNLAISLHRADDEGRSRIMPVNRAWPLEKLVAAAGEYTEKTHRRVTFEYALISGENDSDKDAKKLISLLKGMLCHVNLIPLNEVDEIGIQGSGAGRAAEFMKRIEDAGIPVSMRRKLGASIDGACGQLRLRSVKTP